MKTYWMYCHKLTGEPVETHTGKVYLMANKPNAASVQMRGYHDGTQVVVWEISINFVAEHKV